MHFFFLEKIPRKFSFWFSIYALLYLLLFYLVSFAAVHPAPTKAIHTMSLSDHEFAPVKFVPKPGDKIRIENHSDISHSIYVTYPDETMVNLGVQTPGTTVEWEIPKDAQGEYLLQCWIHPIIRAKLILGEEKVSSSVSTVLTSQELFNDRRKNICTSRSRA
jgi:plastocyanin